MTIHIVFHEQTTDEYLVVPCAILGIEEIEIFTRALGRGKVQIK
jgi:hypothetical protein